MRAPASAKPLAYATRVAAAAVGQREHVRRAAELLDDLERRGLLALDPVRVERVDEREAPRRPARGSRERVVEAAADLDDLGAGRARLRLLRGGDGAGRVQHDGRRRRRARA